MLVRHVRYALKSDHNVYIGRGNDQRKRSPLANPFYVHNYNDETERRERIEQYRVWLWKKMQNGDPQIWDALRSLRATSVLLCHCYPKNCHGHVIVKAWTWAYKQGLIPEHYANHDSKTVTTIAQATSKLITKAIKQDGDVKMQRLAVENFPYTPVTQDTQPAPVAPNALHQTLPPKKKQGRGAPRTPRGIVYIKPDTRYNLFDAMADDLEELYATAV